MKRYIIPILLGTIIFNGCRKDENWPTAEERLNNGAKELFRNTVSEAVNAVEFCEAFQDYLDAPGDDKILDKYKDIRKTVSKVGDNAYEVSGYGGLYGKFSTNGLSMKAKEGIMVMDINKGSLTVTCVEKDEWEIRSRNGNSIFDFDEDINYFATYRKAASDKHRADITIKGKLTSRSGDTNGYSAEFGSDGIIEYFGGNAYSGIFRMTTFDNKGIRLDDYSLRL